MDVPNDSGFGFRKTYANGKKVIFSSLAGELQESEFNLLSTNNQYSITVENHGSWLFGQTAESQSSLVGHSQGHDWVFSDQYLAGLLLSISKCISPKTRDVAVRLTTGLPYRDFKRGKEFRQQFKNSLLGNYHIERNGNKQTIEIVSVLQVPQAYGPIFYHILDDKGELKNDIAIGDTIRVGSLNVGSSTVEIGTVDIDFSNGTPNLSPVEIGTTSRAIGVFSVLPTLREQIVDYYPGEYFSDFELLGILETGQIRRYGQISEVDNEMLAYVKRHLYRSLVEDFLSNVYRDEEKGRLDVIINTGGGANLLDLSEYHLNIWQSDDPQWDTVLGYAKLRKLLDKNK